MVCRITRRISLGLLVVILGSGCSDDDDSEAEPIAVQVSEALEFSWEGGDVGLVAVSSCENSPPVDGECPSTAGCFGGFSPWLVDVAPSIENTIASPIPFGTSINDADPVDPSVLSEGVPYSVIVERYRRCDADIDGPGCIQVAARGCAIFTP
ncbi:MAG: hypothetical protein AAGN82_22385 [Myxococcota bacterium]